jgi:hypothetical protein
MPYIKDSGEAKLRKNVNQNSYTRKKNKNIFKASQTPQAPPKPRVVTTFDWEIPAVDSNIVVPSVDEIVIEGNTRSEIPKRKDYQREIPKKETFKPNYMYEKKEAQNFYETEFEKRKDETEVKQEMLSFRNIITIIAANAVVPILGGFIYFIVLSVKGEKQKAMQSIVLSAIVSIIRLMFFQF